MKVICIKSSVWSINVKKEQIGGLSITKGSIYHVMKKVDAQYLRENENYHDAANGVWYNLLEIDGWHHSNYFLSIPNDELEENIYEKEKTELNN